MIEVYDWCMYMVMSQKYKPPDGADEVMNRVQPSPEVTTFQISQSQDKDVILTEAMSAHMRKFYETSMKINIFFFSEYASEKYSYSSEDRKICTKHHNSRKNSSIVKVLSGHQFGEVRMFLEHNVNCTLQTWAVVDVFPLGEREDGLWKFQNTVLFQRLVHVNLISDPLVYVQKDNFVHVLNDADIKNL